MKFPPVMLSVRQSRTTKPTAASTHTFIRFSIAIVLLCLSMTGAVNAAPPKIPPPSKSLAALFEREFKYDLNESPESATFVGVEGYNHRLSDESPAAVTRRKAHVLAVIRELQGFDARKLNVQDRISRDLKLHKLQATAAFNALYGPLPFYDKGGFVVVGPQSGPHRLYAALTKAAPFRNAADYENYLKRLTAMPEALAQGIDTMRAGMKSGWMPPRQAMGRAAASLDAFIGSEVRDNPLFLPFKSFPNGMGATQMTRLEDRARQIVAGEVSAAFERMKSFMETEYIPACPKMLAASALPAGMPYYALSVKESTTTSLTPQAVHAIGLAEVARISGEMDGVIAILGFSGTRAQFFSSIKADPTFYYTRSEDMLRDYRDLAKRVDALLPKLFAELPRLPYGIRAMDAFEGDAAERYTPGALDGSRAGYFEANVVSLATRPKYDMENTFLHEAVPGHHLQNARANELTYLPNFRRSGWYIAYGEGWALYAESLGKELGLYRDPYSHFAALSWEMVRACRLVIDTGIHAMNWTRPQSIRYLVDNAGLQEVFAVSEVDRYIVAPAQALGYKIGELKIKELRDRAKNALGSRFDIRRFHNALLDDGPLPLTLLERRVNEWIAAQARALGVGAKQATR